MTRPALAANASRAVDFLALLIGSGCFISYLPNALLVALGNNPIAVRLRERKWTGAGFFGAVWGGATFLLLPEAVVRSFPLLLLATAVAILASGRAERVIGNHDDPRIVVDEWIGVWYALWGMEPRISAGLVAGVLLFRLFDVVKGPWGRALQRFPGGWGITLDDVLAGILANGTLRIALFSWSALKLS